MNNEIISNETEAKTIIDEWGKLAAQKKEIEDQIKIKKMKLVSYAEKNNIKRLKAKDYMFVYAVKDSAIVTETQSVTTADVVAALNKDKVGKTFVRQDYDTAAIKEYLVTIENPDEYLEKFHLKLAKARVSADVKPIKTK